MYVFMRWPSEDAVLPLIPVVLLKAQLLEGMDPSRVKITVCRKDSIEKTGNMCRLLITRVDKDNVPSISFLEDGSKVTWTLAKDVMLQGRNAVVGEQCFVDLDSDEVEIGKRS